MAVVALRPGQETAAERRRRLGRVRQRRRRKLARNGLSVFDVPVNRSRLAAALIDSGRLTPTASDDDRRLGAELKRIVTDWIAENVTRDSRTEFDEPMIDGESEAVDDVEQGSAGDDG